MNMLLRMALIFLLPNLAFAQTASPREAKFQELLQATGSQGVSAAREVELRQRFEKREALVSAIEAKNTLDIQGIDALVDEYRKDLIIDRYLNQVVAQAITEEQMVAFYEGNPELFSKTKINISHIFFPYTSRASQTPSQQPRGNEQAFSEAQAVYQSLSQGVSFADAVTQHSKDRISVSKGGSLGWVERGYQGQVFSDVVFAMTKGQVSQPIAGAAGVHIVRVDEDAKLISTPYSDAKPLIHKLLSQKIRNDNIDLLKGEAANPL